MKTSMHTRDDESREMATDMIKWPHPTTELTNIIIVIIIIPLNSFGSLHSFCSCFIKNDCRTISLRSAQVGADVYFGCWVWTFGKNSRDSGEKK